MTTDLAQRYGAPSTGRRRLLLGAVGLVVVTFLAWLAWTAWTNAVPQASSELVTYEVTGEHEATARVRVHLRGDDVVATCRLRATAEDHAVVGELLFDVRPADLGDGDLLPVTLRTERRATAVELVGCTTPDQPRPR